MSARDATTPEITPELLLRAYSCGAFPMADSADDPSLFWVEPEFRGVIPMRNFNIASRLARTVRSDRFTVTVDHAFARVGGDHYDVKAAELANARTVEFLKTNLG